MEEPQGQWVMLMVFFFSANASVPEELVTNCVCVCELMYMHMCVNATLKEMPIQTSNFILQNEDYPF